MFLFDEYYYIFSGAVASMFWVDAELGVDIYLDGKFRNEFFILRSFLFIYCILVIPCIDTLFKLVRFDDEVFEQILKSQIGLEPDVHCNLNSQFSASIKVFLLKYCVDFLYSLMFNLYS